MTRLVSKAAAALLSLAFAAAGAPVGAAANLPAVPASRRAAPSNDDERLRGLDAPQPARFIGPYRILRELGAGGMGEVFLAESTGPVTRRVALKRVRDDAFSPRWIEQFQFERQALAALEHENIARLYEAGDDEHGRPWLAMEWVDGEPITRYCERRELPLDERLSLFASVAGAVEHMHARGVLHGDLKPENILVCERDGRAVAKVIDLGLARRLNASDEQTQFVMGTPAYMAPEHFAFSGPQLDQRADVFALGVVLRELIVGEREPQGGSRMLWSNALAPQLAPSERLAQLDSNAARRALPARTRAMRRKLLARLRGGLDALVRRATAIDREQRTGSAAQLVSELESEVRQHHLVDLRRRAGAALGVAASLGALAGALVATLA